MRPWLPTWLASLLWLAASAADAHAIALGEPYFETVGDAQAIPDGIVTALAEDPSGLIWIGSVDGLLRYDGYRYRRFDGAPGDPHALGRTFIQVLHVARDARLWIGNYALGVAIYDPASGRTTRLRHAAGDARGLASDSVRAFAEEADGSIWIGTRAGLDLWHPGRAPIEHFRHLNGDPGSLNNDDIAALLIDRRGALWVGSGDGLNRRRAGARSFERLPADGPAATMLAGQQVTSLLEAADGRLWVLTRRGDRCVMKIDVEPVVADCVAADPAGFVRSVGGLVQPLPEQIWIAGADGIEVVDAQRDTLLRRMRHDPAMPWSLASNDVRALLQTRSGEMWIGGYGGGLQRHDPTPRGISVLRHSPTRPDGLSEPSVTSILELPDGRFWFGTRGNGIDVFDRERGVVDGFRPQPGRAGALGTGWINALARASDGDIWVGTSRDFYRFRSASRRFEPVPMPEELQGQSTRRLLLDSKGILWIATTRGVGRWTPQSGRIEPVFDARGEMLNADVNALVEDRDGRIWVGSDDALHSIAPGMSHLDQVDSTPNLDEPGVVGLLLDRAGQLWVDTTIGLYRMLEHENGKARFEAISAAHGIAGRAFGANLVEDGQGRIWSHRYLFDPNTDTVQELTRADITDIGTGWFRSFCQTHDGLLLFGASKGVLVVAPDRFRPWDHQPPVVATDVRIDGVARPQLRSGTPLVLPPDAKGFSVEFAALDFSAPQFNRYAYRLLGYADDWIETDADHRSVGYSNLWPGQYRLQVRGSNRRGSWSAQPLDIPVRVLPAYWQTWWFALLMTAALAGLIYAMHRWRVALLARQAKRLQRLVQLRTSELSDANARLSTTNAELERANADLSAAHQHLLETRERMVMQEKMASLGSLIAGVAHEINTPLGVAVTASSHLRGETARLKGRFESGELKREDLAGYVGVAAESTTMVDANLARAAALVRSFKQVSVDRSLDERRHFELDAYLPEVLESLRPMWRKRGIRFDFDCEPGLELDSYPGAIAQIVANLVQNALMHAFDDDESGSMQLDVRGEDDEFIRIEFSDDGRGIAAKDLGHVFEPFYTTRRARGGTGLGLHIVFNLVNAKLGGRIDVTSEPGRGTRFILLIARTAPT
jgi:signal transduction histidine kinase/streptogramin lyase